MFYDKKHKSPDILECWLYKKPIQKISLIDGKSGQITPKEFKILFRNIRFCTSYQVKKNYVKFVTIENQSYYKKLSLMSIVKVNDNFAQISKDTIINLSHVDKRFDCTFLWSGEHQFEVSRPYRLKIKNRLEKSAL